MLTDTQLGELARMLQQHTPLCQLSDMQVRAALELMQQRGWEITVPKGAGRDSALSPAANMMVIPRNGIG